MILFVCTGNTCRSPLAAALAQKRGVPAASAGLAAQEGSPASWGALCTAKRLGLDLSAHRARAVTAEMVNEASRVYAMTGWQAARLRAAYPHAAGKIAALDPEIPDPYGGGDGAYEACAQALLFALDCAGITGARASDA